ncbi:protein-arginine deiminase domain-containing protein [Streptomyces clavuligerus]|nr:hypothetical protein D1794_14490 [Streptomyces clavuligerus]MBY6303801.1 protein-arginine deiminase domain-containing protein [Streptomyces clavuligerus]QCS06609.1 hypothetical protein CRV15_13840 [Streptomyces clavuligerus]QPJ94037.1 hypothetical protein GE265_14165 [Streptomyces clavuligerus]QPL66577.1 protein-arginine deiminase domain-containing protein [Streptomyces clavuligerus]
MFFPGHVNLPRSASIFLPDQGKVSAEGVSVRVTGWRNAAVATGVAGALIGTAGVVHAVGPAAGPAARAALTADLRADVDRDGSVDITGGSDTPGENVWTRDRGAVMLPNIDDDTKRCPVRTAQGKPLTDAELAKCNDAADTVLNGASDAADLARLKTVPLPEVSDGAYGTAVVLAKDRARLFVKRANGWTHLRPTDRLTAAELRAGVELGIEATDVIRNATVWDGQAIVRFSVTDSTTTVKDDVRMGTAPVLTHHHRQKAQEVLVTAVKGEKLQEKFVKDLEREVKAAGITKPVRKLGGAGGDRWAQDFLEPGYVSMTGPGGKPHAMRVMIRSAQDRKAGREVFEKLRGKDIGAVQMSGRLGWNTLDSMGNLETIPPYAHGGKEYPAGRIIMGHQPDARNRPAKSMSTFLRSQGAQSPLLLDTAWLGVGHVDEFVQFLPAATERGWRIGVADPQAGVALLRKAQKDGHGRAKMFSVPNGPEGQAPKQTIDEVLKNRSFHADNKLATERIEANLRILKNETGITDAEIIRIPGLYSRGDMDGSVFGGGRAKLSRLDIDTALTFDQAGPDRKQPFAASGRAGERAWPTGAYVPGAVNGVVLSDSRYLAAKQWGPVIQGKDIFGEAVSAAYARAGFTTRYIDDWYTYHVMSGEVHCGTNTLRDTSQPWWKGTWRS